MGEEERHQHPERQDEKPVKPAPLEYEGRFLHLLSRISKLGAGENSRAWSVALLGLWDVTHGCGYFVLKLRYRED